MYRRFRHHHREEVYFQRKLVGSLILDPKGWSTSCSWRFDFRRGKQERNSRVLGVWQSHPDDCRAINPDLRADRSCSVTNFRPRFT